MKILNQFNDKIYSIINDQNCLIRSKFLYNNNLNILNIKN